MVTGGAGRKARIRQKSLATGEGNPICPNLNLADNRKDFTVMP
jgi:hypothetical protein